MIHLDVDAAGNLVVLIEDAKEEPQLYRVEAKAGGLELAHTTSGKVYGLRREQSGWTCSCKSYEFRQRRNETDCKHSRNIALLGRFADLLATVTEAGIFG